MFWRKNKPEVCGYLDHLGHFHRNKKDRDLFNLRWEANKVEVKIHKIFREAINTYEHINQRPLTTLDHINILKEIFSYIHTENKLYIVTLQDELESIKSEIKKLEKC